MRQLIFALLLAVLSPLALSAQSLQKSPEEENADVDFIPGKCYHKILFKEGEAPQESAPPSSFYIKLFEPEFEQYTDTIVTKPAISFKTSPQDFYLLNRRILITPPSTRCFFEKELNYPGDFKNKMEKTIVVCLEKTPPEYKIIRKTVPKEYVMRRHHPKAKVVSPREVIVVKRKRLMKEGYFKTLDPNIPEEYSQVDSSWTKVEQGAWSSGWREIITIDCCLPGWITIEDVQKALVEKGYGGPMSGRMEYSTKVALKKYQHDNHLLQGRVDMATLRSLGLVK